MPRQLRICIVTPGPLRSNPRVAKEAQALHDAGYDVTVVSTRTLVDPRDDAILASAGWRSIRLDIHARGTGWRLRRVAQFGHVVAFRLTNWKGLAGRAFSPFAGPLAATAQGVLADFYIAHYPAALPAAAIAARRHGALYAFDAEDFHLGEWSEEPRYDSKRRLVHAIERRYLLGCAHVTAASPGIADAYVAAYGIVRPTVVLNVFPLAQGPSEPTSAGTVVPGPSVYWFSQTIGPDRGLQCAVRAMSRARTRPHLYLRGSPVPGFIAQLRILAAELGITDRLHILSPAAPSTMGCLAARYDVGLVSETGHTLGRRIALTNKQFTYILAGVPAVMSDIPAHRTFALEVGQAVRLYPVDDADGLAAALDGLLGDPVALAAARTAAFRMGQSRFNWDIHKGNLLESLSTSLMA